MKDKYFTLANNIKIPAVGFGTWQISNSDVVDACLIALNSGYRHIDTALAYNNEKGVSEAIKKSGLKREEIFITTKLPAQYKGYNECLKYFNESLKNLDTNYIDLYLIHAPWPWSDVGKDCTKENIATGNLLNDPIISKIAQKYNTSNANICLSYCYLKHTLPLPKSTHKERIVNNINFFVNISLDDIKILDQVHNKELDRPLRS